MAATPSCRVCVQISPSAAGEEQTAGGEGERAQRQQACERWQVREVDVDARGPGPHRSVDVQAAARHAHPERLERELADGGADLHDPSWTWSCTSIPRAAASALRAVSSNVVPAT